MKKQVYDVYVYVGKSMKQFAPTTDYFYEGMEAKDIDDLRRLICKYDEKTRRTRETIFEVCHPGTRKIIGVGGYHPNRDPRKRGRYMWETNDRKNHPRHLYEVDIATGKLKGRWI